MQLGRGIFLCSLLSVLLSGCGLLGHKSDYPPLASIAPELHVGRVWVNQTGGGAEETGLVFKPALEGEQVFFSNANGNVVARQRITGARIWQVNVGRGITSSPGVGGGSVFIGTHNGKVVALDASNGQVRWKVKVPNQVVATPRYSSGLVIVKTINGELVALSAETGEQKWSYVETLPRLVLRGDSAPVVAYPLVVSGFANGNLVGLTVDQGKLAWERKVVQPSGFSDIARMIDISADPVVADGVIYVTSYQGNITAVDFKTTQILWQHPLSSHTGIAVSGDRVYVTDTNGRLWSFNRHTGAVNWRQTQFETRYLTAPAVIDDYVIVGDDEGYIHWMAQSDGHPVARQFFSESGIAAPPLVSGDLVFAVSRDGRVVALNPRLDNLPSTNKSDVPDVSLPPE